ncbi:MAG: HDOD domain-containing protein [Acidobacteriota bacterium]|nr:HDOD domain-containing protein [Acidobacteriota bacterium]
MRQAVRESVGDEGRQAPPGAAAPAPQTFVARQPIFDEQDQVFAYELLFRSGLENYFNDVDTTHDLATSHVISEGAFLGLDTLTQGKLAFVNFSRAPLVNDLAFVLPRDRVVIEVLETVEVDQHVVAAVERLKAAGYRIALDDFPHDATNHPLLPLADFVKVDFLATPAEHRRGLSERFLARGIHMLAEKVETREAKTEALEAGYRFFQGYFFSRPVIVAARNVPAFRMNYLRLLQEITDPDVTAERLEAIVKQDLSITYRLLRHVNSAAFGFVTEIKSLRHALALLGLNEIRRWASVWAMADLSRDTPGELVVESALRGRFCELLAAETPLKKRAPEFFLMGLFSHLDAIMSRPLDEILSSLPVPHEVREALLGQSNPLRLVLDTVIAYEAADWERCAACAAAAGLSEDEMPERYLDAAEWTSHIFTPGLRHQTGPID